MAQKSKKFPSKPDDRLRLMLDAVLQPVAVVDLADEIVLYWSESARNLFGHTPEIVEDWYSVAYPDKAYRNAVIERWKRELELARETEGPHNAGEYDIVCKDGSKVTCELQVSFVEDYLIIVLTDITEKKQQEEIRRRREQLLAQTEEIGNIGSWEWDIEDDTVTWSDQLFRIFGIAPEVGAPSYAEHPKLYTPESMELLDRHVQQAVGEGASYEIDLEILRADGSQRICTARGYARKDESGRVIQLYGSFQDITERKRDEIELKQLNEELAAQNDEYLSLNDELAEVNEALRAEKERAEQNAALLQAAMENSQAGIAIADLPDGKLKFVNEAGLLIRNQGEDKIVEDVDINKYVESWQILHMDGTPYKTDEVPLARAVLYGEKNSREFIVRRDDEEDRFVLANAAPVYDKSGEQIAAIVVFLDITELKLTQVELQETVKELKLLNRKYREAMHKAEESDALKSVFLANMSHEIRTPMNGIIGFTNLLLRPDLSEERRSDYIDIIRQSSMRMLNTVNDLIDISRIETGQIDLQIERVDLCHLIESITAFFRQEAEQKGLKFELEMEKIKKACYFDTDIGKFESILSNLLKNAIKFTHEGFIKLTCSQQDHNLIFKVEDSGIGIEPKNQESVFSRFVRENQADGKVYEGSGLGLAITHGYVELLGGRIWMESEPGKGSTFIFLIPRELPGTMKEKVQQAGARIPVKLEKRYKKLLIAEDDETSYLHLHELLKEHSGQVLRAETGKEAVDLVRGNADVELVLMDIKMPVMDGLEATRKIREFNSDVHIVGQSAYALQSDRQKSIKAGCDEFITKPIIESTLFALLKRLDSRRTSSGSH